MSYKINVSTILHNYSVTFGKKGVGYFANISGVNGKVVAGDKERVNQLFKKFITEIGLKEEYKDYITHFEKIDSVKFSSPKIYVEE